MHLQIRPEVRVLLAFCGAIPFYIYYSIRDFILALLPEKFRKKKDISGSVVLITGAGSGIGRELSIKFSRFDSIRLFLLDLNKNSLLETQKLLHPSSKSFLYECDVSKREMVYELATVIKQQVGKIDILINNAGIVSGKYINDLSDGDILKTMEVNAIGHFWMLKAFLPEMMQCNSGHIVSVSSQAGMIGLPKLTDYCASKFAAVGLMESLRIELDSKGLEGVKTTTICPNLVATGLFAGTKATLAGMFKAEMVAEEILNGVLENKGIVVLPKWSLFLFGLKYLVPDEVGHRFYKYIGLRDFMTTFTGRTTVDSNTEPTDTEPTDTVPSGTEPTDTAPTDNNDFNGNPEITLNVHTLDKIHTLNGNGNVVYTELPKIHALEVATV